MSYTPRANKHQCVAIPENGAILCAVTRLFEPVVTTCLDECKCQRALEAQHTERELDMLRLMVRALRQHGAPDALYLDNGSTYRGDTLRVACGRLGISLLHAKPYDPEARGKMERFWRTLREQCLCFLSKNSTLHDVNVRIWAWLSQHYHVASHAGLFGACPSAAWARIEERPVDPIDEQRLRDALTVRERRRVRRDTTITVEGEEFELDRGFLAGQLIVAAWCPLDNPLRPWAELHGKTYELHPVDAIANSRRRRPPRREGNDDERRPVDFDPNKTALNRAVGRLPRSEES